MRSIIRNIKRSPNTLVDRPAIRLTFACTAITILACLMPGDARAQSFSDVGPNHWAASFIETLGASGVTSGCGGGKYCPDADVTRAQMAVFLERAMRGSTYRPPAATGTEFSDVGAASFAAAFIEQLSRDGITAGCGGGKYCPSGLVTRAQMAVFLLRAKYGSSYSPPAATGIFSDVPLNYWAVHWIEQLAAEGITSGCGGGNYCPESPVTRAQMAVFLVRAFELDEWKETVRTFVHVGTPDNTINNWTVIDHPLLNNNQNAIVIATQNWNPMGSGGVYNGSPIGVFYDENVDRWAVFNQDQAAMPAGAAFNIRVVTGLPNVFVHTATGANLTGHVTTIDDPLLNNNPDAIVQITQNWNPPGSAGVYNNNTTGVFYIISEGRWAIFNQNFVALPEGAAFNVRVVTGLSETFVHTAAGANLSGHVTTIDDPSLNDNPDAIVQITQNWNPPGSSGVYNDNPTGVFYIISEGRWAIFNQNFVALPEGAAFNVRIVSGLADAFVHTATQENASLHVTNINHPRLNGNPDAIVQVTQNWNPPGSAGVYNGNPMGVFYIPSDSRWAIFNQNFEVLPEGAAFNVRILEANANTFVHTATSGNIGGFLSNLTVIDNPELNNDPNAIIQVTQNWNPPGSDGVYNVNQTGVFYDGGIDQWTIFNQSLSAMPEGAAFNVHVVTGLPNAFVHTANLGNIGGFLGNFTVIDHPLLNNNPFAIVQITPNWNPPGSSGVYNNNPTGVFYITSDGQWAIFNQNLEPIPDGAAFNINIE